jgi:ferredoxin
MKVVVNKMSCEAHGVCVRLCPELFVLGDTEVELKSELVPEELEEKARAAVNGCPRQALSIEE